MEAGLDLAQPQLKLNKVNLWRLQKKKKSSLQQTCIMHFKPKTDI